MNKKIREFIFIIIAPSVILGLYIYFMELTSTYTSTHYVFIYYLLFTIVGNLLLGFCLFMVCRFAFNRYYKRIAIEYLLGIIFMFVVIILLYFNPLRYGNMAFSIALRYGLSQCIIFIGVYLSIFLTKLGSKGKVE